MYILDNIRGNKRVGNQSIIFSAPVNIKGIGTVAGKKESEGPLGQYFDVRLEAVSYTQLGKMVPEKALW